MSQQGGYIRSPRLGRASVTNYRSAVKVEGPESGPRREFHPLLLVVNDKDCFEGTYHP